LKKVLKQLDDERKPAPKDNVFVNRYKKPWKSWRTAFKNACERAKINDFHFHDLRHCFGSWLAMNGTDIKGEDGTNAPQNGSYDPEILAPVGRLQTAGDDGPPIVHR